MGRSFFIIHLVLFFAFREVCCVLENKQRKPNKYEYSKCKCHYLHIRYDTSKTVSTTPLPFYP